RSPRVANQRRPLRRGAVGGDAPVRLLVQPGSRYLQPHSPAAAGRRPLPSLLLAARVLDSAPSTRALPPSHLDRVGHGGGDTVHHWSRLLGDECVLSRARPSAHLTGTRLRVYCTNEFEEPTERPQTLVECGSLGVDAKTGDPGVAIRPDPAAHHVVGS